MSWIQLVNNPRLPAGACSATYVAAPPYSPPSARPWAIRSTTRHTGAQKPIVAYVGSTPTSAVARPITTIVTRNVYFRPIRSPIRPNTSAPNGRTEKPTPNSARLERKPAVSLPGGKNSRPKKAASVP